MSEPEGGWELISEEIRPVPGSIDAASMASGEPGIPLRFTWRGDAHVVEKVLWRWKSTAREGGRETGEKYVRRHWVELLTTTGERVVIYCERQARKRGQSRWWIYQRARRPSD